MKPLLNKINSICGTEASSIHRRCILYCKLCRADAPNCETDWSKVFKMDWICDWVRNSEKGAKVKIELEAARSPPCDWLLENISKSRGEKVASHHWLDISLFSRESCVVTEFIWRNFIKRSSLEPGVIPNVNIPGLSRYCTTDARWS